ncbi:hypothetical protein E2C01_033820 [Portunus trituberculatus]|uniref:Uncharacterized protein n=1 Tax=Portunus trituberculatus TaxID=210409 RepID=A0A5B7F6P8_PORTR|nr:hypothetical protein [Portunus trituberculatus]
MHNNELLDCDDPELSTRAGGRGAGVQWDSNEGKKETGRGDSRGGYMSKQEEQQRGTRKAGRQGRTGAKELRQMNFKYVTR